MLNKLKDKTNIFVFILIIFSFSAAFYIGKDKMISEDERRYLATLETLEPQEILKGSFASLLETYSLDQFPARQMFRELKSFANYNVFQKIENQEIIVKDDYAVKVYDNEYKYNTIKPTIEKINKLYKSKFLKNKAVFVLVPDKTCYLNDFTSYSCDYNKIETKITSNLLNRIQFLSIYDKLDTEDYYYTDTHWSQDKIIDVSAEILGQFNIKANYSEKDFTVNEISDFRGILASQAALNKADTIRYLSNDIIDNLIVYDYEKDEYSGVYALNKLSDEKSMDNYDIFLSGATGLLRIDNNSVNNNKTLIIFRDSFGSSITPLLAQEYKTTYVVDLRYISANAFEKYIEITGKEDVLFLYSAMLINIPENFKI